MCTDDQRRSCPRRSHTRVCRDRLEQAVVEANDDARLSPLLSNQSMCRRPVPLLTETLKEQHEEEEEVKGLFLMLMMISTHALLMETEMGTCKTVETEVEPCRSRQKWLMQSLATGSGTRRGSNRAARPPFDSWS